MREIREILFKGKRIDNGEWVEGYFAKHKDRCAIMRFRVPELNAETADEWIKGYGFFEVDPETVCQYTGLTDKTEKKIFEGDIINDINYGIMRCMYLHGSFVWYKEDGFHIKCMNYIPVIEVIGNVYDNPDLLTTSSTDSD